MSIKRIEVTNFKSFEHIDIELGNFNVIIGANASGKSNFVDIFRFLRDIATSGLDNAISMQGGVEYLRNINIGASKNLSIKISSDDEFAFGLEHGHKEGLLWIETYDTLYQFALKFNKQRNHFKVIEDRLILKNEFFKLERKNGEIKKRERLGRGEITIFRSDEKIKINLNLPPNVTLREENIFPPFLPEKKLPSNKLLLETPYFLIPFPVRKIFDNISIYDFDPKLPKKAYPITGKAELEENGENLSIILKNILQHKDGQRKLFNLVKELLPFVENLDVEKFADKSLLFKLQESYFKKQYLPASLISDGTINITALIIALYFEKKSLVIIEEPERNIHPYLISKVVNMMKDASQRKQIIVTTHNPEFVRHADLENILLVSRGEDGFSIITRPADKEEVKTFLKNDIGIDELYIQNLL